jgi:hypothetical protein
VREVRVPGFVATTAQKSGQRYQMRRVAGCRISEIRYGLRRFEKYSAKTLALPVKSVTSSQNEERFFGLKTDPGDDLPVGPFIVVFSKHTGIQRNFMLFQVQILSSGVFGARQVEATRLRGPLSRKHSAMLLLRLAAEIPQRKSLWQFLAHSL